MYVWHRFFSNELKLERLLYMKTKMILSTILVIFTAAPAFASGGITCRTGGGDKNEIETIEKMNFLIHENGVPLELLKKQFQAASDTAIVKTK